MNKGDIIQIKVDKYAFEGKGIGKIDIENPIESSEPDSFIVFVNGAYPGDTVSAKIKKLKKSYAEAIVEEVITPSQQRVQPRCKYFGTCGGCKQQDLDYAQQIAYKQEQVEDIFKLTTVVFQILKLRIYFHQKMFFITETKWSFHFLNCDG